MWVTYSAGFSICQCKQYEFGCKTTCDISQGQTQVDNREITVMLHSAGGSSLSTVTRSDNNNIDKFYILIGEDVKLLEHTDELPFINTPLHIAASYGNMQYKSLLVYSFYRISVILYSYGILVIFADIDFLRCWVKYDLCQTFSSYEDMKIYRRDTNLFFTRIPWSFLLVANEKKPKIYVRKWSNEIPNITRVFLVN